MLVIASHAVPVLENPVRLQEYGVGIFDVLVTKSALKKAIKKELILVNETVGSTATFIKGGEQIELLASSRNSLARRLLLNLEVVYEDDYLAIINKPAGILVSGNSFKTVANALAQNLMPSQEADAVMPQPVHRLDYPTTGLLLIGKTSRSIMLLSKLFEEKKISKVYHAVTIKDMKRKGLLQYPVDDKAAESEFEVLQVIPSERFEFLNLVRLKPSTGRRHQLRKHLLTLGNPILGDAVYAFDDLILKGKGLYLHASELKFVHPFTKEELIIKCRLPKKFGKLFKIVL
ncbi:RluA family pseudouridine synthase [Maribacter sp. MJ134]|uniref:RluA family pseudouridine synthase n=1 Tax=Maribacter sp. MJ134 TaxID=2496865 RepID=UPI000F84703D|nr:RluA family pseudouridine synthase [Maribacter sp. MJ134]AZQ58401.1 RluA family pseudouridine synthase [Maribacter sp. MJ134]